MATEYAPQYPWAVDWMGPPCDPKSYWLVYNGSLFCNYQATIQKHFMLDLDANIALADGRWRDYYGAAHGVGPMNTGCMSDCWAKTCNCKADCSPGYCGASDKAARAGSAASLPPSDSTVPSA